MKDFLSERQRIVASARSWLGTPYRHQASTKGVGSDCLGLIRGVWRETQGVEPEALPAYSSTWAETGGHESLLNLGGKYFYKTQNLAVGDILVFRMRRSAVAKHVGICTQDKKFIHAYDGTSVVETWLSEFWSKCHVASFVFPSVFEKEAL